MKIYDPYFFISKISAHDWHPASFRHPTLPVSFNFFFFSTSLPVLFFVLSSHSHILFFRSNFNFRNFQTVYYFLRKTAIIKRENACAPQIVIKVLESKLFYENLPNSIPRTSHSNKKSFPLFPFIRIFFYTEKQGTSYNVIRSEKKIKKKRGKKNLITKSNHGQEVLTENQLK